MREYLKNPMNFKDTRLREFAEKNGANYVEEHNEGTRYGKLWAVWMPEKKHPKGTLRVAVALADNGSIFIGKINESCLNFEVTTWDSYFPETAKWMAEKMLLLSTFKPSKW